MRILLVWILNAVALWLVTQVLSGVHIGKWWPDALIAVLVLGLVNTLIRPILVILTLPVTLLTLGLFLLVINALLFYAVGSILKGFQVDSFWWAFGGALLYSLLSWAFSHLLKT
ncbi:MAG TPA: phage holin family protein [Burkholderiaceae bacterium]|nr:phage holin family protein [Burkholderiaceae bacterium]